ncbi:MAG TPA: hypothetical protein VE088_02130 [Gaiellaceae bacterium]|jgi:hypothetical protein|nr:hypothetical protein [Gaiellaceae bacterium]
MDMPQSEALRGQPLLVAHLQSLDPEARSARQRLEEWLGAPLARKLLFALAAGPRQRRAA